MKNFAPEAKGHGVPEVMDAIYYNDGKIRSVVAVIKSLASALSIGSGGSVGREGPIIQIGAAFGSTLGQLIAMAVRQRAILIAAGAGGGIAATFNTPIGGVLAWMGFSMLRGHHAQCQSIADAADPLCGQPGNDHRCYYAFGSAHEIRDSGHRTGGRGHSHKCDVALDRARRSPRRKGRRLRTRHGHSFHGTDRYRDDGSICAVGHAIIHA